MSAMMKWLSIILICFSPLDAVEASWRRQQNNNNNYVGYNYNNRVEEFVNKDIIQLISNGDIQLTEDMEQLIVMSIIIIATHQILTC